MRRTLPAIFATTGIAIGCGCLAVYVVNAFGHRLLTHSAASIGSPDPDTPRPVGARDTVFIEEMTWLEVRDAMRAGMDTVIVATGGVEQCGPYLAMGKHNYILRATTDAIARKLGNALVAPIIAFVPQGGIDPPTDHMRYAGTVSLTEPTYRALLRDVCACFRTHGFGHIVLIGDSFGNLAGMEAVAAGLNAEWAGGKTRVHFIPEYYNYGEVSAWLGRQGIHERPEWLHDDFAVTAMLLAVNPALARAEERLAAGRFRINGIDMAPVENTIAWGQKIVDFRATVTIEAIRRATAGGGGERATTGKYTARGQ